jgi:hypothetical protein
MSGTVSYLCRFFNGFFLSHLKKLEKAKTTRSSSRFPEMGEKDDRWVA